MNGRIVPGDKSIAHRFLILSTLAQGESVLTGVPVSLDVASTIACLQALGAQIDQDPGGVIRVAGPARWSPPTGRLHCGNSGTTARLVIGLLTGLGLRAELEGDASLMRRPMDRVVYPLQAMGGRIAYLGQPDRLPVRVEARASGGLRALRYRPRVSSAQVRAALLLAALSGRTDLEIIDRLRPRDHTERILRSMGVHVDSRVTGPGERIRLQAAGWDGQLSPLRANVPGDLSSAAFLIVAALLAGRDLTIRQVGINPTRAGFLRVLQEMGADLSVKQRGVEAGEPVGDVTVRPSRLRPFTVEESMIPQLIDEVPALAVLASRVEGISVIRGAGELRVKESDRLTLLAGNLAAVGVVCEESKDGLQVQGSRATLRGVARTGGDHRIAMAFGVLGASPDCDITVDDRACVAVSFPGFWEELLAATGGGGLQ